MRLTTKGRYAVTAMLDLSLNYGQGAITLSEISERQGISLSYLEQLFSKLRKQGLVGSVRGPGGGYHLSSAPDMISILAVVSAVDENVDNTACKGEGDCHNGEECLSHKLWVSLSEQISTYLEGITLAQVVSEHKLQNQGENVIKFDGQKHD